MGKWVFTPEHVKALEGKRGDRCRVHFEIEEIRTEPPYADMPHIVTKIISLNPLPKPVDPIGLSNDKAAADHN